MEELEKPGSRSQEPPNTLNPKPYHVARFLGSELRALELSGFDFHCCGGIEGANRSFGSLSKPSRPSSFLPLVISFFRSFFISVIVSFFLSFVHCFVFLSLLFLSFFLSSFLSFFLPSFLSVCL